MTLDLFFKILYLQTVLSAIVACVSLYSFKKRDASAKLIGLLFLFGFLGNAFAYVYVFYFDKNGNIISSIYELIAIVIITGLYSYNTSKRYKKGFIAIGLLLVVFGSLNLLFLQRDNGASYNRIVSSFIVIFYCLFYFYRLIRELPSRRIHTLPMFWFTSAFLFYYSTVFFLFAVREYLVVVLKDDLVSYWSFHNIVSIVQHGIILIGLYFDIKREKGAEISIP